MTCAGVAGGTGMLVEERGGAGDSSRPAIRSQCVSRFIKHSRKFIRATYCRETDPHPMFLHLNSLPLKFNLVIKVTTQTLPSCFALPPADIFLLEHVSRSTDWNEMPPRCLCGLLLQLTNSILWLTVSCVVSFCSGRHPPLRHICRSTNLSSALIPLSVRRYFSFCYVFFTRT